jgi:hypothetical protein
LYNTQFAQADFVDPTSTEETEENGEADRYAVTFNGASYDDRTTWPAQFVPPISAIYEEEQ